MNRKAGGGLKDTILRMSSWFTLSEASPLLPAGDPLEQVDALPTVEALETTNFVHLQWQDLVPQSSFGMEPCKDLAFALIVLLRLRRRQIAWKGQYPENVYRQWTEEEARARNVEILEEKMSELWESFLTQHRGPLDLHDVLWTPFLLKQGKSRTIRGVHYVGAAPLSLMAPFIFILQWWIFLWIMMHPQNWLRIPSFL